MNILLIGSHELTLSDSGSKGRQITNRVLSAFHPFSVPAELIILKKLIEKHHNVKIVEIKDKLNVINYNEKYDIVGISSNTHFVNNAYKIADEFRRRGVAVVLGGWHVSALPEEAKQHADAVVIGEAEYTWPQLVNDFGNGRLKPFYYPDRPVNPRDIPYPISPDLNSKSFSILATRGCPNGCEFCAITNMIFRNIYRERPIKDVIEEIKMHSGKYFSLRDASLTINTKYSKELFKELIGLNKVFHAVGNINILARDEELLRLSREAGCQSWFVGFESVCQESLNAIKKRGNKVEDYIKGIKKIHDYGMIVEGSFILGFDQDTADIFEKTYEFTQESDLDRFLPHILTPYPGTPIYNKFEREKRIFTKDWVKYDGEHVVFQPKHMTPEELFNNTKDLESRVFSRKDAIITTFTSIRHGYEPFMKNFLDNILVKMIFEGNYKK